MRRALALTLPALIALASLAACHKPATPSGEGMAAAASDQAPSSAASAPAASSAEAQNTAKPAHNWTAVNDKQYLYYSHAQAEGGQPGEVQTTTIRYLGQASDGAYVVAEVEGGAMVLASCSLPCTTVRLRGQGLDQTAPLGGDSVVKAALDDAIAGKLEPYPLADKKAAK